MVSTFTPNIQIEEPARGDDVGTWDTPVNNNMTLIDLVAGGTATVSLNNSNIVLAAAQFQSKTIVFNSTLTGSVTITFPTSFTKSYEIYNSCTGSSAFIITLQTTAVNGVVCPPPGVYCDVINTGVSIRFKNFGGPVGTLWEYGGSSVPSWVANSNPPPYANCDGGTFSAVNFPQLAVILGSTTFPDSRGRVRATLNQTTTRMKSSNGGIDGNTNMAAGGFDSITLASSQIPASLPYTDPGHFHNGNIINGKSISGADNPPFLMGAITNGTGVAFNSSVATIGITINPSGGNLHINNQPTYIGGITLIRLG